jgi:DNA-binding MarR family transcriptional regulator
MSSQRRTSLLAAISEASREQAGRALMLHGAIAEQFGLNFTDLKCLDLARAEPELTAGRIADATGLSTSAITSVLDRLERRGFIERRRDPTDRRKVVVVSTGTHELAVNAAFAKVAARFEQAMAAYTDEQLAFLLDVTQRLNAAGRDAIADITSPVTTRREHRGLHG